MNLIKQQIANEFKSSHHLTLHVMNDLVDSGYESLAKNYAYMVQSHIESSVYSYKVNDEIKIWNTKEERHKLMLEMDLEDLAWKVIAVCTAAETQTFTQCVGMLKGNFKNDTERQDIESASECIALLSKMNLIDIKLPRDAEEGVLMVFSKIKYDGDLGEYLTTSKHIMPSIIEPSQVTSNKESGYRTFDSSLILAGKYHSYPVPLDHINRVNSVALSINKKALEIDPTFKEEDEDNPDETTEERCKRYISWKQLNVESMVTYAELVASGNKFYLTHKYDERLRTYAHGYQVSTQGDSYRKSVIELANKEVVIM
jgi:hypothetical protein